MPRVEGRVPMPDPSEFADRSMREVDERIKGVDEHELARRKGEQLVDVLGLADVIMEAKRRMDPDTVRRARPIHTSIRAEIEKAQHDEA